MTIRPIEHSVKAYESWLRKQLGGETVGADLEEKHTRMADSPFAFLRATYWRWAERILSVCDKLEGAPTVLAIGDIHLENFGTWRDEEGRLVWGINDFDEAAEMPYALDLVRLATSAILAGSAQGTSVSEICKKVVEGYEAGIAEPQPFVLDQDHRWLRNLVGVSEAERADFWNKMTPKRSSSAGAKRYVEALAAAMPAADSKMIIWRRRAGLGSLGRPRWVALSTWRGGPVVREAKAIVPSSWTYVHGPRTATTHCEKLASGGYRSPDPWYRVIKNIVVRRLSPNNRKIELKHEPEQLLAPRMLRAMGYEVANIHLGATGDAAAILRDLKKRKSRWLRGAAIAAADMVREDHRAWKVGQER